MAKQNLNPALAGSRPVNAKGTETTAPELAQVIKRTTPLAKDSVIKEAFRSPLGSSPVVTMGEQELEREKILLEAALMEENREMGKKSFWFFLTRIMFPDIWEKHYSEAFHKPICDDLAALKRGESFWAFLPRKRRKSYIISLAHTLWLIINDHDIRILLVGAREATVKTWAKLVRDSLIPGCAGLENFQATYPEVLLDRKSMRRTMEFTIPARKKVLADPTFRAAYIGVTGAGWRCDVLKFNDPVERRNVTNPEMSSKILTQMLDLYPLLDDTGDYINVTGEGTRWAYHDPYGAVLGEAHEETESSLEAKQRLEVGTTKIVVRHAGEDPKRPCEHCPPHILAKYPHGHPSMEDDAISCDYPVHTMKDVHKDFSDYMINPNLGESMFYHQLMNVCMAPGEQKFKKEWFLDLDRPGWPVPKRRVLVVDSADKDFQKEGQGDYMVALFGEWDDFGRLLVRYGLRSNRWTRDEFQRRIITWCRGTGWWPTIAVKEKFTEDTWLKDMCRLFRDQYQAVYPITGTRPNRQKKLDWILEMLQSPMERGEIIWGSQVPRDLRLRAEHELTSLGQVVHDDIADCLGLFFVEKARLIVDKKPQMAKEWAAPPLGLYQEQGKPQEWRPVETSPTDNLQQFGGTMEIMPGRFDSPGGDWNVEWNAPKVGENITPPDALPSWARSKNT